MSFNPGIACLHGTHVEVVNSTSTSSPGFTESKPHGRSSASSSTSLPEPPVVVALPCDDLPPPDGLNDGGSDGSGEPPDRRDFRGCSARAAWTGLVALRPCSPA